MNDRRDVTLDVARGLAILAIVVGHVGRGLGDAGILSAAPAELLDRSLYFSHLMVFVVVSGALAPSSVQARGASRWLWDRTRLFLYLYVLWSLIQGIVRVLAAGQTNTEVTWSDIPQLWVPRGHLWFLPLMAAASLALVAAKPWVPSRRWTVVAALALSLLLWGTSSPWIFTQGWALLGGLFLGAAVGWRPVARVLACVPGWASAVLASAGVAAYGFLQASSAQPPTYFVPSRELDQVLLGMVVSALGVVVVMLSATLVARSPLAGLMALLGRESLAIFLAHIIAASGARIVLVRVGVEDVAFHLIAGTTAGVALPLFLSFLARRRGLKWLLSDTPLRGRLSVPARTVRKDAA